MTYFELLSKANRLLNKGEITIGQRDEMTKPLWDEIRPKGEWKLIRVADYKGIHDSFVCPFCNYEREYYKKNFCEECGADMRKGGTE